MKRFGKTVQKFGYFVVWISVTVLLIWAAGAIWYFDLLPHPIGPIAAVAFLIAFTVLLQRLPNKRAWLSWAGLAVIAVWLLTLLQQPLHDRDWAKDQTELSSIKIEKGDVTVHNFRHSLYRSETDYDVHRRDFEFKLEDLRTVWFIVQHFSAGEGLAHVFLSFELQPKESEPQFFSVSIEIRREADEHFSPVQGLYQQYELNYVFGDERDLIGVRTVMRPDDRVFMYPVNASADQVRQLFTRIAERANQLHTRPEFYHTILNNCMNGILRHTVELTPDKISWFDPEILLPGYSDRYAYKRDIIGSEDQPFDEIRDLCRIDQLARKHGIRDGFSEAIRKNAN